MKILSHKVFYKSIIVYAVELHLFTTLSTIQTADVLAKLDLEAFDLWRTFESFLQLDTTMPRKLKDHFIQLEKYLIQSLSWKPGTSFVLNCKQMLNTPELQLEKEQQMDLDEVQRQENKRAALMKPYHLFFKRVLNVTAV